MSWRRADHSLQRSTSQVVICMRRSIRWHLLHLVHNCIAHPMLPLAEILEDLKIYAPADAIYKLHDVTSPKDDQFNRTRYLS